MASILPNGIDDQSQRALRIAQINAENLFLFFDSELPTGWQELSESEWQKLSNASITNKSLRKALWLAESLQLIDADFLLVNEVGGEESLANFSRYFLADRYKAFVIEGNSDRGIDVGYLVKRDLLVHCELHTHKNRPINFLYPHETGGHASSKSHYFSRDCAELRVSVGTSAEPQLIFLLVHLKSKLDPDGIDPEGRERRAAELKALVSIYLDVRREFAGQVPVIVGGDFNGIANRIKGEKEFRPLFEETDLEDVLVWAGLELPQSATQVQFNRSGLQIPLQIDYLFGSPELQLKLLTDQTHVFRYREPTGLGGARELPRTLDQRLLLPSDHFPVVATFHDFLGIRG